MLALHVDLQGASWLDGTARLAATRLTPGISVCTRTHPNQQLPFLEAGNLIQITKYSISHVPCNNPYASEESKLGVISHVTSQYQEHRAPKYCHVLFISRHFPPESVKKKK
ncbi:unnamed protein product [Rangifer tarandus platyrhynchus]|uniref:Uncharacterized protein n=1 Tax=Rangifer tarandus platyrhynchus TaxID=3082113 RepID=A0AC59Y8Y3_RANTA